MLLLLKNKAYLCYLSIRVLMSLTSTGLAVSIGWHVYQATGNAFDLALVALVQVLPTWLLFLLSGWIVDNVSRRLVILLCLLIKTLIFFVIALEMQGETFSLGRVLLLLFLFGCCRAFFFPAMQSTLPVIVDKKILTQAVSNSSTIWTIAMTSGPILGGVLLGQFDRGVYWLFVALLSSASVISYFLPKMHVQQRGGRSWQDLTMGIRFVWHDALVFPSITLDLFIIMMGSVMTLLPIYASDVLHLGPEGLGLLRSMPALGSVVSGLVIGQLGYGKHAGRSLFYALFAFAVSIMVFALSTTLWLSLMALFVYGFSDMVSVIIRSSITHLATPDFLRGRVNAVNSLFIVSSNELGDFRAGLVAGLFGAVPAAAIGSLCALLVAGVGLWRSPKLLALRHVEEIKTSNETEQPTLPT